MEVLISLIISLAVIVCVLAIAIRIVIFVLRGIFYFLTLPFQGNWALEKKLVMLLNGDRVTANRLIQSQRRVNRDRSYRWCLEKVIRDLERDRYRS